MGYLPHFRHDIFISYAHVDDLTPEDSQEGWISLFHKHLEVELAKRVGRLGLVKIWRDTRVEAGQRFDQTIREALQDSALFLAVTSPGYLTSTYCMDEVEWFRSKCVDENPGLMIGDRSRMMHALLHNVPYQNWPEAFHGISQVDFYNARQSDNYGEPHEPGSRPFRAQLLELVRSIYETLCALRIVRETEAGKDPVTEPHLEGKPTVFLADTSDSLRTVRRRLESDLGEKGVRVIRAIPPPYELEEHEAAVRGALEEADVSVHLFDHLSGRDIQGAPGVSYSRRQAELAHENRHRQLIWIPQEADIEAIEEESHRTFLSGLEKESRAGDTYRFVRESQASVLPEVIDLLSDTESDPRSTVDSSATLLVTHSKDQLHALELSRVLFQSNIQPFPFINPDCEAPTETLTMFESLLKQVNSLIVVFGSVAEEWVRGRLKAALEIVISEDCPLRKCCVYLAPPRERSSYCHFNMPFLQLAEFDSRDMLDRETLSDLLKGV